MRLNFVSTGPKFPYVYYIGVMTVLRSQDAPVVLWVTEVPQERKYFDLLLDKIEVRQIATMPDFPALRGKDDHDRRVATFDYSIWRIVSEYGGVIMGLDSITLGSWQELLEPEKEMLVPVDNDRNGNLSMHGVVVRPGSEIAREIHQASLEAMQGNPDDFTFGSAGILPYRRIVGENLDKVTQVGDRLIGGFGTGAEAYWLEDRKTPLNPDTRTIPLYGTATGSVDTINETFVQRGGSLYARLVQQILSRTEWDPLGANDAVWRQANKDEAAWWGECTDTANEEAKQATYARLMGLDSFRRTTKSVGLPPLNMQGKSVLDIGGGPISLLLKCRNLGRAVVVDPIQWPNWVLARYEAAGIEYIQQKAEDLELGHVFDEVWLYNVLEHVQDPAQVIAVAKRHGQVVRIFEWLEGVPNEMHLHTFTRELLDGYLGVRGKVHEIEWGRHPLQAYSAVIGMNEESDSLYPEVSQTVLDNPIFHFHLLGLAHVPTHPEVSPCAYTQKVVKLARMLKVLGHHVTFYGGEGSSVECDEFVQVVSDADRIACYGDYDWRTEFFKHSGTDSAHMIFNENAIREINARKQTRDFLLCPMGNYDQPIADAVGLTTVESGVGYRGVFAKYRIFESYTWMMYVYGLLRQNDGSWYDAVIPNYFDPEDFPYQPEKDDYFLYIGRLVRRKGLDVAVQVTRALGAKLIIAGQGNLVNPVEGLNIVEDHVEHIGSVDPEERKTLMGKARAVFVPTYYIEPFGGVAVEAMMCGTPVITTDWGVFSETVLHNVTGYRCRTFDDFVWAARNIDKINPATCHEWAIKNYSMDRVGRMYNEYFRKVYDIWDKGWYQEHPDRNGLEWLVRYYPESI